MAAKDARRDAVSRSLGWTTERVTWYEVRRLPEQTRRRVLVRAAELRPAAGGEVGLRLQGDLRARGAATGRECRAAAGPRRGSWR